MQFLLPALKTIQEVLAEVNRQTVDDVVRFLIRTDPQEYVSQGLFPSIARLTKKEPGSDLDGSDNERNISRSFCINSLGGYAEPEVGFTKFDCLCCCKPVYEFENDFEGYYPEGNKSKYSFGRRGRARISSGRHMFLFVLNC